MGKYSEYKHRWYEEQKIKKANKCIECGRLKSLKGVRCGSCQAKIRSKTSPPPDRKGKQGHLYGEGNPRWRGGISSLRNKLYASTRYKKWRDVIFKRDNYICQKCYKQGGILEADHYPIPYRELIKNIKTYREAMGDERLWKAGGRTLCKSCHRGKMNHGFYGNQYVK